MIDLLPTLSESETKVPYPDAPCWGISIYLDEMGGDDAPLRKHYPTVAEAKQAAMMASTLGFFFEEYDDREITKINHYPADRVVLVEIYPLPF